MIICTITVQKVVDIAKQSKERVNKHITFSHQYQREILNNGNDDDSYTKLTLLTHKKIDLTVKD